MLGVNRPFNTSVCCVINCTEIQGAYATLAKHKGGGVFKMPDV